MDIPSCLPPLEEPAWGLLYKIHRIRVKEIFKSIFKAINGLCDEIVALYEDLRANRNNLGLLPEKWLGYLDSVITIHENR